MNTQSHTLSNGLRVLLIDTESFPTVTALVMVGAGSRYERKDNNGIAHFFEHMAFKGSKKYKTSFEISSAIEGIGGVFNAFTSKDHTGYWIKATTEHTHTLLDVLSDMILHPLLEADEIEREKGVIVEEINMYEDMPSRKVGDIFEEVMYKGSQLGFDIAGTKETVTAFNRKTFTDYIDELYHPNNAVVVIAGGLQGKNYLPEIEKKFGTWKNKKTLAFEKYVGQQKKPILHIQHKKTEQVHMCIGFKSFSFTDERKYALQVLAAVLGGGMSSRLFMEVREKRGLCYYISTGRELYADTGSLVTQAGIRNDKQKIQEAINVILEEHMKIVKGTVSDEEVEKAKELLKGRYLLSLEDSMNIATMFGSKYILEGEIADTKKVLEKLKKISKKDIIAVAKQIFIPSGLTCAIIGPLGEHDVALPVIL
ncbi:MAG: pitrilysin family protein [Candidatus Roizmanbacteria bacterium]|nr:pitrilysin family protein [Candidatus Roizmanbacteria bacterium]